MRRPLLPFFLGLCFLAVLVAPRPARAGIAIGADVNAGVALSTAEVGTGFSGRFGYDLKLGPLGVTPEVGGGYVRLAEAERPVRLFLGGRLHLGGLIQPAVYWHYGYAWIERSRGGPTVDMGGALDLSLAIFRVGVHAGYVSVDGPAQRASYTVTQPVHWIEMGLHAGLGF